MKTALLVLATLSSTPALAALPPYWDSVRKITAVMNSDVSKKVAGSINSIQQVGDLTYVIGTRFCQATVTLEAHHPGRPGATSYTLKSIDKVHCI